MTPIQIFVRHAPECKYAGDELHKRCTCPKHCRWSHDGKQYRKSAKTRSWADAETFKRDIEDQFSGKPKAVKSEDAPKTIEDCVRHFIQEKTVQGIKPDVLGRYVRELGMFQTFCEKSNVFTIQGVTREMLTALCASWSDYATGTQIVMKKRVSGFIGYCYEARWIPREIPLPKIADDTTPTMPLTTDEYARLLAAIPTVFQDATEAQRVRSLFQLMRFSGLAIRDALTLKRAEIHAAGSFYRITTSRQKTGTHVSVPIPAAVAAEVLATPNKAETYIFWDGKREPKYLQANWGTTRVLPVFEAAGIQDVCHMKSHRLRDTFAVDLLEKGVPLEEVSKLLGHESIVTTERHYAKWVKGRQDRLDNLVTQTWAA